MEKKEYIKPEILSICVETIGSLAISNEDYGHGSDSDSKEQTGLWGEIDDEDPWANSKGADLWSGDADEEEW